MGRTVPTYRITLEGMAARFAEFRRALREGDRRAFDRVMDRARAHASAASYEASLAPEEVIYLAVLLDQEISIERLQHAVDELAWAVLGRPAASAGTLDAFGARRPGGPEPSADRAATAEPLKIQEDYIDKVGRGWAFTSKEEGGRASSAPPPNEGPSPPWPGSAERNPSEAL